MPDAKNPHAKPEPKKESKDEIKQRMLKGKNIALTDDGGVHKKILQNGVEGITPSKGDTIYAHYIGRLTDGTVFDSSIQRKKPIAVEIGIGRVVKGWDIAIQDMELGESAALTIKPEYGYGQRGKEGMVPKGATMQFLV